MATQPENEAQGEILPQAPEAPLDLDEPYPPHTPSLAVNEETRRMILKLQAVCREASQQENPEIVFRETQETIYRF